MGIVVKNERAVEAVKRLAELYQVSYTAAIEMAAEAALRRPGTQGQGHRFDQAMRVAADYRTCLGCDTSGDADGLYDERGLFR